MKKYLCCCISENKPDFYHWLLLDGDATGGAKDDPFRDQDDSKRGLMQNSGTKSDPFHDRDGRGLMKPITELTLHKLILDEYFISAKSDIAKLEKIAGRSVLDLFDDDPAFSKFGHLRALARNRDFEIKYYGKVR